ncbi:MAG: hypothetical protein ABH950_06775 [Candidatus Altiarchaeota archaeon]
MDDSIWPGILFVLLILLSGCLSSSDDKIENKKSLIQDTSLIPSFIEETNSGSVPKEENISIIVSRLEEVTSFLELYPSARHAVFNVGGCEFIAETKGVELECTREIDQQKGLIFAYWMGENWKGRHSTALKIGLDSKSGEIKEIYPKLDYINDKGYCESDSECVPASSKCACVNFIHRYPPWGIIEEECGPAIAVSECGCIDNTCESKK